MWLSVFVKKKYLSQYLMTFQGFSDYVFRWYVEEGKRGKLMGSSLASHPQLSHFLEGGDNKFMSWLHDINANDFYKVSLLHFSTMDLPSYLTNAYSYIPRKYLLFN